MARVLVAPLYTQKYAVQNESLRVDLNNWLNYNYMMYMYFSVVCIYKGFTNQVTINAVP